MKISQLGEFGLIDLLTEMVNRAGDRRLDSWQKIVIGIGDDAAAWQNDASIQLATVDSLIHGIHFSLDTISWEDLGWKALAVNLSDIAAMGGVPRYALVSLSLPADTEVDDVVALYRGMIELARQTGVVVVGGDVSRAPLVTITITILGNAKNHLLTRSAAIPGEQIAVTGHLGGAAGGLMMLTQTLRFDAETTKALKDAFVHPCPRLDEGQLLVGQGVKATIDISDGLIADLTHICQQSQIGARIEAGQVPVHPAVKISFGDKSLELALAGGEDYELLFTAESEVINRVKKAAFCPITVIGETIADNIGEVTVLGTGGKPLNIAKRGWEHFTQ